MQSILDRIERALLHGLPERAVSASEMFRGPAPSFALYVHVPFCGSLCAYCSFNKRRAKGEMDAYAGAVLREADRWLALEAFAAPEVTSVFVGGGTPSFLPAPTYARMIHGVLERFRVRGVQVTSEANPESIDEVMLHAMKEAGVTRISIGVQTFDELRLRRLGRRHRRGDIQRSVEAARATFDEVSIDLMYGHPGQTVEGFMADIDRAIALPITHVSIFPLVYRPETTLGRRNPNGHGKGGIARLWRMYDGALDRLADAGFRQYTSEDFTRGEPCRYQLDMWEPPVKATLGLGAGALSGFGAWTWHDIGDVDRYIAATSSRIPIASGARMSPEQRRLEHVLVALHTLAIHPSRFEAETGVSLAHAFGPLPRLASMAGLLARREDGAWTPTRRGRFVIAHAWTGFVLDQLAKAAAGPDRVVTRDSLPMVRTDPAEARS